MAHNPDILTPAANDYNLDELSSICRGDVENMRRMLGVFVTQGWNTSTQLTVALEGGDTATVLRLAHRLKSSLNYLAMHRLISIIRTLEETCDPTELLSSQHVSIANAIIGQLNATLQQLTTEFQLPDQQPAIPQNV